jgi:two-component system sensor histidine kinase/response regulator
MQTPSPVSMNPDTRTEPERGDSDSAIAERHLREKAALGDRAEAVLAALSEGVVIIDGTGVVTSMNDAAESILGTRRKYMVGQVLVDLPWEALDESGEPLERTSHPLIKALRSGEPQPERTLHFARRDGRVIWIATAARPLRSADGTVDGAVSSFRDVTAQKAAEDQVRSSEAQYRSLFELNGTVQVLVDTETGIITAANPAAVAFYGISREALVGANLSSLNRLDPSTTPPTMAAVVAGKANVVHRRHYLANGEPRDVEIYASPVHSGGKTFLHAIITDITARLEAERGRNRLAAILDLTPDVVGMFDDDGQLFYANRAGRLMMGLPAVAEVSDGGAMTDIPKDAIRQGHEGVDADRVLKEATVVAAATGQWTGETHIRGPLGRSLTMHQVVLAHRDPDGTLSHFSTIMHDVSEMRRVEYLLREQTHEMEVQTEELIQQSDELLAARDASEQANAAKSQFLAHMSHELRTPLTAIIGFARVLVTNRPGTLTPQQAAYAERIASNAIRLLGLINEMLDLSKVEAGQMELETSETDVRAMAIDVIADLEGRERSPGVALRAQVPDGPAILMADPTKLRQVLVNLVGNALKFTLEGSVVVGLETNAAGVPTAITVTDTGVGIAPEHQAAVFEPFAQEDTTISRRFGGTGLGLAISKRYCEMMGFSLVLESEVGVGSTFRVRFSKRDDGRMG